MVITLKKYCERNNRKLNTARRMALRGSFKSAEKIGRDWYVEETEPWPDHRVKSGKYIGWRKKKE